jgi:hypothetical protein
MSINPNYFYIATAAIFLILIIWLIIMEVRLRKIFRGKGASDLEEVMKKLGEDLKSLDATQEEIKKYLTTVEKRLRKSLQTLNTVRFNPFEDSGSNQSFAISFLDEEGDGVVISSLYSREKVNIYAKPIKKYESEYTLSEEEKEAVKGDQE